MPNKYRAPKCKYNYESEIALRKTQPKCQRCTLFEFPKDPARRRLWISRIPRIWKPKDTQRLFLSEIYFKSEDIIKESTKYKWSTETEEENGCSICKTVYRINCTMYLA